MRNATIRFLDIDERRVHIIVHLRYGSEAKIRGAEDER